MVISVSLTPLEVEVMEGEVRLASESESSKANYIICLLFSSVLWMECFRGLIILNNLDLSNCKVIFLRVNRDTSQKVVKEWLFVDFGFWRT